MRSILIFFFALFISQNTHSQATIYVSVLTGNDSSGSGTSGNPYASIEKGAAKANPGDTVLVLTGNYRNATFNNGDIWKDAGSPDTAVVLTNVNGTAGNYITIKPAPGNTPIIEGDGDLTFQVRNCSYLQIEGFEIKGIVQNIPVQTAWDYWGTYRYLSGGVWVYGDRKQDIYDAYGITTVEPQQNYVGLRDITTLNAKKPNYFSGNGLLVTLSHHINIINNNIHHFPGGGLRITQSDYVTITGNSVHDNTSRANVGTHGLVIEGLLPDSGDNSNVLKCLISKNRIYNNYNELYSWVQSKTICTTQIDEGKGIALLRTTSTLGFNGLIRVENNICYGNGKSGIHANLVDNAEIINNTVYNNGQTNINLPLLAAGPTGGISMQTCENFKIINNIVTVPALVSDPQLVAISHGATPAHIVISNNIVNGGAGNDFGYGSITADPNFVDATLDAHLLTGSPAINAGIASYSDSYNNLTIITNAPTTDFDGVSRTGSTDIGAYEFVPSNNANLSALSINTSTISPVFNSGTITYTGSVSNSTTSVTVTPTKAEANANISVQLNGGSYVTVVSGVASSALSLNVGSNTINVKVTAQDGTTIKTYTITITRDTSPSTITSTQTTLSGFAYNQGNGPSNSQSFTVGGTNLTNDIIVTPSTNYEISTDNSTFQSTNITLVKGSGTVAPQLIYTRLKAGLTANTYNESISIASGGANVLTPVSCSGIVTAKYYYDGSGSLATLTNWWTNTDGTGSNPVNFTANSQVFVIRNTTAVTTTSSWTVSGTNSKIILGDSSQVGVSLTVANTFPITGTIDIATASSGTNKVLWQHLLTSPTFGSLENTSEVHFQPATAATYTFGSVAYGKLFIDGAGVVTVATTAATTIIKTAFNVAGSSTLIFPVNVNPYMYIDAGAVVTIDGRVKSTRLSGIFNINITSPGATTNGSIQLNSTATLSFGSTSTIEYTKASTDQIISVLPSGVSYANLTISETGATAVTTKTFAGPITVNGTLTISLAGASFSSTTVNANYITLGNGATIVRTAGSFDTAPNFGSTMNVIYNGSTAISSGFEIPTSKTVLNNLTIATTAATVTLTSATSVNNKLTLTSGTLATGGFLTLKSTATQTAYVAPVVGTITGDVVTERYIPAGYRAYRLLSSPVTTSTSVFANWQEGGTNGIINTVSYGTHITGAGGAANGFDATATNTTSLYTHNNLTPSWNAVVNTNGLLTAGSPYLMFIRGSRQTINLTSTSNDATTLRATGTLKTGTVVVSDINATADGFSLIGNPYQAQVDMQAVLATATNLNSTYYYVLNPKLGTKGQYVAVDVTTPANNSGDANKYLQPWQGCFVKTVATAPATLSFVEANKSEAVAQTSVFRTADAPTGSRLRLSLYNTATLAQNGDAVDQLLVAFDANETNAVNENDAIKMTNLDENFATSNSNKTLCIEKRAIPTETEVIPLTVSSYRGTSYTIKAEATSLIGATPYLVDNYTGTTTEIPQNGSVNYAYTLDTAVPVTTSADRFKIIYGKTLGVNQVDYNTNNVTIYKDKGVLYINSGTVAMENIKIFDIQGRVIWEQKNIKSTLVSVKDLEAAQQVLILKITTEEGKVVTQKVVN